MLMVAISSIHLFPDGPLGPFRQCPAAALAARPGVLSSFSWLLHVARVRDFLTRTMCAGPRRSLALSDDCLLPSTLPEVVEAVRTPLALVQHLDRLNRSRAPDRPLSHLRRS